MVRQLICAVLAAVLSASAWAFDPFVVKDIRIEGIQRIEAGTVFNYLPVKVGETFNDDKATQAIRALFGTGFFRDVRIEVENNVLIVVVEERPAIASISFSGMKEFEPEAVRKGMRETSLQEGRVFDRALVDQAEQEIKRQYLSKGKYGVTITTTITPLERNRVAINFAVDEGEVAKIKQINIVGNKVFSEAVLLDQFVLRTPGWLTWYTKNDQYSRQKLQGDIENLRSFYLNRGYLDFNVESTQVSITPDRQDIYIAVNISEGEKYTVSEVKLGGDVIVPAAQLLPLIQIKAGEAFSRERLNESTKKITERLGVEGYAFANANAVPQVDRDNRTVSFTIMVDPGRRVYVRRINVVGNSRTRDEVVRRELRQLEGAFYDGSKLTLSKERVDRTQYFSEVDIDTTPVAGATDQVDVTMKVKEKPTGAMLIGLGFSSAERVVLQGSVSQSNFLGSGNTVGGNFNTGKINQNLSFSYTNPYYTVDGLSRGFDVHKRRTNATSLNLGNYSTDTIGGGVNFGYPLSEQDAIYFGLSGDRTALRLGVDSPPRLQNFASQFGSNYVAITGALGWGRDTRDSAIWTTKGLVQRANLEVTPAGDLNYYRYTYDTSWFYSFTRDLTMMLRGEIATADGFNKKPLPFFKNYYSGGIGSVRGFRTASLGPRDPIDDTSTGGNRRLSGTAELLFPMPGAGLDRSLRVAAFVDSGQVYGADQKMRLSDLRYSTGLALAWLSPMGPIRISIAAPLNHKAGDKVQRGQFTLGQTF
ncbi:MAG: outer membrane protein assembly factor BamA [Betaproteobacteria bacterium RIFCSPLOWO2_02_FULL_62_17]|nr:MAG: outer membrane protein assembly factor BamA [Betaproteobacteria bacterium RIFCSPLOWO2_02_FULL_62_17]